MLLEELATPCLLVERGRLAHNLSRMQARADAGGVALRPHAKTHKSVALARLQREAGARGLTVAKPSEAEVFVHAGFADVRVAYSVAGEEKLARLFRLAEAARVSFCVDTPEGAQAASDYFAARGRRADVLVEVDTGHHRCGVGWDAREAAALVRLVAGLPGLTLRGLLTHAGQGYHGPSGAGETLEAALRRATAEERDRMLDLTARLRADGVPGVEPGAFEISVGSTPTMRHFENREHGGFRVTEIRPGNYVFHDAMQVALGSATLEECALTVLSTVVSRHRDATGGDRVFLDAGKKILTSDGGYGLEGHGVLLYNPRLMSPLPHARITALSEEHGWVRVPGGSTLRVGDRVRIVPNHACVTVNTRSDLYVVDGEEVVDRWRVDAQGMVW